MAQQTAMQQLIKWMEERSRVIPFDQGDCYDKAIELLQMEKEQIVNAFVNGISEGYDDYICTEKGISRDRKTGKEYFAGMYKNDV